MKYRSFVPRGQNRAHFSHKSDVPARRVRGGSLDHGQGYDGRALAEKNFFSDAAKARAAEAVKRIEAQTSAEIVITVRQQSGHYRGTEIAIAAAGAFLVLNLLLFLPQSFAVEFMPLDVAIGFVVALVIAKQSHVLRRIATRARTRAERVELAAKGAFFDFGVSRTTGRTGILVYVSILERTVSVVADLAVQDAGLAPVLESSRGAMAAAVASRDFPAFIERLEALGPALSTPLPRSEDDVNELSDEVR